MGRWRTFTKGVLVALLVLLVLYDALAFALEGDDATISRVVYAWAKQYPILVLAFGVLLGHLFVPQHIKEGQT